MAKRSKKKKLPPPPDNKPVKARSAPAIFPAPLPAFPWKVILQAFCLAATTGWIYWPVRHGDWLWDDNLYITENAITQSPLGLWSIWFEPGRQLDYYPIKSSVQWLQWRLWGMDTLGYHLTNLFLHLLSALLVWRLLSKFGLRLAWLGGLIFAIHPVQVESVAWIAELKNTLSLPPFLLAICFWMDYDERGKAKDYWLALGLFLVAMLCKTTMVMFPVIILLYAWWKRRQVGRNDLKASAPFFLVSLVLGLLTLWLQHTENYEAGEIPVPLGGLFSRLACAGLSLSFYFSQSFLPVGLMPVYPRWVVDPPSPLQFLPWPVLGGLIFYLWTKRQGWGRHALLGLGFFTVFLAPFLGLNPISYMNFTWVMDHFLYLPIIGLIGLAVAALGQIDTRLYASLRPYGMVLVAAILALLADESRGYAKLFIDQETLWSDTLAKDPNCWIAHNLLGYALFQKGQADEAIFQFRRAVEIAPDLAQTHDNLGNALSQKGRVDEAITEYRKALEINPNLAQTYNNLGLALFQKGQVAEAMVQYQKALAIAPNNVQADNNLANALFQNGQVVEAIAEYRQALALDPTLAATRYNLGLALEQSGRVSEAIEQFQQALRLKPDFAAAQNNLARLESIRNAAPAEN